MAKGAAVAPAGAARSGGFARFMQATELDARILGMLGALAIIWIGFDVASGGVFLTPRNLWNLSVQTASIAVMATGMVLVIVTRNIDLSVGSVLGFVGMVMGVAQAEVLPQILGFDHGLTWLIALLIGMVVGGAIGALHGFVIAYLGVPAFIVTLGGLLAWRGAAWWMTSGRTVAPMDSNFRLMGGGPDGAIGDLGSWTVGIVACLALAFILWTGRRQRVKFDFPLRPLWAEAFLLAIGCAAILGAVAVANAYPWPERVAQRWAEANGVEVPAGGIAHGLAIPVLIAIAVGVAMTFLANRSRFGRYVFAIGGNPEAANLAGINTAGW
jgi:D-xylose transport system permease protein